MKKILFCMFLFILIIPNKLYAVDIFNNGPEPSNKYYMHYKKIDSQGDTSDYWLYISSQSEKKYLLSSKNISGDIVTSLNLECDKTDTTHKINSYLNGGSLAVSNSFGFWSIWYSSPIKFNYEQLIASLNNGLVEQSSSDRTFKLEILENTIPIKDINGQPLITPKVQYPVASLEEYIKIILPRNSFVQSGSLPTWNIKIAYKILKTDDFNLSEWEIKPISNTVKGIRVISNTYSYNLEPPYNYVSGIMSADYLVPIGENKIYFTMKNTRTGKTLTSDIFTYYNLEGFVDENKDGIDDRSGLTEDIGGVPPDWNIDNQPVSDLKPWSFETFFSNVSIIFSKFFLSIQSLLQNIGNMSEVFKVVTSVVPQEILTLMTASVILFIILKIFGR